MSCNMNSEVMMNSPRYSFKSNRQDIYDASIFFDFEFTDNLIRDINRVEESR
jgi:hypothetical protein